MASPQRPDPNEPRRDYEDLQRASMERRAAAGAGLAWWWVFWIIIIALAIWWAGWGWGGSGGWWWGGRTRNTPAYGTSNTVPGPTSNTAPGNNAAPGSNSAVAPNQAAISGPGLDVLNATDKNQYVGKPFQANQVPVQKKISNQVLWIGANNGTPMLLVLAGNGNSAANAHIDQSTLIDVTGTVQKAPPQAQAKNQWKLSDDDASQLARQDAYIQATQVHVVQQQQQ